MNTQYIDNERWKKPHFIITKPLRLGNTIQWILLWKGSSPVHLPLQGGILLLSYRSTIKYFSSFPITLLEPIYIMLPSPKNILEEESSRSRTF